MNDSYVLEVRRFDPKDKRLGRHVIHDSRSRRFRPRAAEPRTLASVRHRLAIPVLDQGDLGSCTGNAATHLMGMEPLYNSGPLDGLLGMDNARNQRIAIDIYAAATRLDPWPGEWEPEDTGSNGLSVAKVLQDRGLISGYLHAFGLNETLTALARRPVTIGTGWHESMYQVHPGGEVLVAGAEVGGHQYVLDELDVERERVWMLNSWGEGWGEGGRAWMSWRDLGTLLDNQGDCTVLVPANVAAPTPLEPAATDPNKRLADGLRRIMDNAACPKYLRGPAVDWLTRNGF